MNRPKGKISRKKIFRNWICCSVSRLGNAKFRESNFFKMLSNSQNLQKFCSAKHSHYTVCTYREAHGFAGINCQAVQVTKMAYPRQ